MEKKYQLGGSVDPTAVEEIIDPLAPQDEEQLQQVEQFKGALRKGAEELRQRNTFQFHTERPKGFGDSQYDLEATQPHHIENFEEMRGQRQGIGGKSAAAIAKLSLGTAGHVVGGLAGVGYGAFELAKGAVQGNPDMKDFTNNSVFMFLDEYTEALQENFPHYYTQAEREKGLIDTLGTMNFWGDKMVNGLSFLASAAITEVFAVGLGNLAGGAAMGVANAARFTRLSNMLSRSATGAKALSSLKGSNLLATAGETLTLTRQLATGAGYESALEARDAYNRVLDTLLENDEFATRFESAAELKGEALTREEKIKLLSDTEKEAVDRKATDLHNAVFAGNMFLVGTSNMIMLGNLYGPGRASRAGAQSLPSSTALTKVADRLNISKAARDRIRTGGKFAGRMAYEGLVEEGGQNAMGKAAEDYALHSVLEDDEFVNAQGDFMDSVAEGVGDTLFTQEGKEQMLIGALLGGMGIPTRKNAGMLRGMGWSGDSADVKARRALLDLDLKGKDKSRMESLIKEKMENDPEFLNRFKKKNYMAYQLYKRTQARNAAQESGDLKAQKDVEADDMFDYLMYRYDNGDMSVIAEEMEDMLKTDPETFKATFGYAPEMSIEDVQARQSELKQTVKDAIKRVEKASLIVDSRLKLSEQQKFTDIAVPGSQAHLRRVLIHSATMIEDRDKREKQLIAKLAELSGGKVQETSGEVDAIVFNTPEGPVTVKVGGLNLGATVQEQLEESELRISEIQGLAPNRRSVEQENELKNLTLLRDKLLKETDKDRSLYSVTLEDMSSDEKKELSEWEKLDPVNSALNREEVENTLRDLRKLRADRLFFARTFNRFMDPDTRAGAIERISALREAYLKEHLKKQGESEARIEEFKLKLEQYKADLAAEYESLSNKINIAKEDLEAALRALTEKRAALDAIEKEFGTPSKKKSRSKKYYEREKLLQSREELTGFVEYEMPEPPTVVSATIERAENKIPSTITAIQEASDWLYSQYKILMELRESDERTLSAKEARRLMKLLEQDIVMLEDYKAEMFPDEFAPTPKKKRQTGVNRKFVETELRKAEQAYKESQARFEELVLSTSGTREDIKELTRFIKLFLKDTSDPQLLDPKLKAQFEEAWDKVIASGTVSERSELGTPESDAFRAGIYGILQMNENAFEALTEAENDIRERLEELKALNDLARGILAQETTDVSTSVLEDQIALNDAQITKLEAELEIILAQKEGERTKEEIYQNTLKNYMAIRLYETFRRTIARELDPLRTPTEETKVTDNTLDIEQEQADGVSPVDKTEEEKTYRLPDISDPGFFRSTGEHDSALKTFNELSKKQKKTPEDLKNLAIAEHQLAWFEWLHNSSKDNSTDPFVRMMIVHSKMVPADMQELTAYTGADKKTAPVSLFYGETEDEQLDDIKLVAVKLIYDKGNYVGYKPVRENGRLVFSSMLRPNLTAKNSDGSPRERFSNKQNLSENAMLKKANEHKQLRENIQAWTSPKLVRITGKSMGSLELDSTQMEFAEDAIELDPKKMQNVPLFVAAPEQTTKQTELKSVRIQLPGTPNLPKVMGRTGTVWAYDQSRGMLVPMNRTLLSENEAKNVSRMFHLLLKKSKEEVESGTSLKDSKKRAEEFKVRTSGYAIPLWEQISDIVYTLASQGSNYTLTTRLIGKELAVVYGPANEIVKLSDFESNSQKAQDFITFLRTKYHQVNAKTLYKNGKPSVVREKYEKDGKKYDKNTFIAAEGAEWVKVELNENLEPIEDSKNIFKNYNAYLLSKNKDGYAPLKTMSKAVKKVSLTSRRARGGYVTIQNDPSKYMPIGGVEKTVEETSTIDSPPAVAKGPAQPILSPEEEETELGNILKNSQGILEPTAEEYAEAVAVSMADVQEIPSDAVEISADQVSSMSALIAARKAGLPVPEATVPPVNLPEDLNQSSTSEDEESPFMGVLAADSPFVNTRMESISEEMVRATGMTPLEIALTDVLLTSKDGHAVAQLTDFGKVLLSTLAPAGAIYHEAFHNISLYILSTNDSKRIYDAVRRVPGTSITYQGIEKSMSSFSDKEAEEWLADTFRKWILSEGSHKIEADKDDRSMIQRFFDTLKGLIKRLFNVNDVFEYDPSRSSIEHLFTDIKDGKFLQSVRDSSRGSHSTYDMGSFDDTGFSATLKKDMIDSYTGFIGYLVGRPIKLGKESEEHTMELQDIYRAMSSKDPEVLKKLRDVHGMAIVIARRYLAKREAELSISVPKKKIELVGRYTDAEVKANPNKVYVFGDNTQRTGTGGQAQIRNNPNVLGIATKLRPSNSEDAFMSDKDLENNKKVIDSDIQKILSQGKPVVFPKDGFGTGLARLKEKAPKTYSYLKQRLLEEFNFDNDKGEIVAGSVAAEISPELIAVQNAIQLFGRNGKEGDPEMIRALQLEYMKKLGFTADKEDGYEDDNTSSRSKEWDKNAADDSPSGTASGILKMLVGTLQDPSSKNSLGLPGIYNGAEVLKMLQNDTANSTTYAQVIAKMESLVGAPGRPWMAEVLRRVKSVSDSSIFEDMLLRSEMSRQFRKHAQDPWQLNATAEGRMNSFDAAGLATEAKIRTAWQANLAAIANDKRFTHVSFTPSGKVLFDVKKEFTLSNGRKVSLSNLVPAISDMKDWDTLLDTAELFGIEFSSRGALKQAEDSQEIFEQVRADLRGIVGAITEAKMPIANLFNRLTDENTGAVTRANNMIRLELRSGIIARERSFLGQENRPQYSLVDPSAITFVANSSPNQLPHLDPKMNRYTQGALTWKVVSETPDSPMGIQVRSVLGLNTDAFDDDGTKLTKAELNDLLTVHIGALMDGVTVIPRAADKTLEIGVHLPIWDKMAGWGYTKQGKFSAGTVMPLMLDYLRAEIEASVMGQKDLAHIDKYTDNIKELRMFKFKKLRKSPNVPSEHEVLTKQFLENELKSGQAYAQIKAKGTSSIINDFIEANKGLFENIIRESIVSDRENLKVLMEEVGLLVPAKKGAHTVYGLGKTAQLLDTLELNETIEDLVLRHSIGKQEVFKMFLGDPAFYSDLFKRVGGAVSAKILADTSEDLMILANKYGDLHRTDGFLDMITISEPIAQMPENILAEYARFVEEGVLKSYEQNIDLADGALFVDMPTYRMLGLLTQQWEMDKETAYDALKNGKRTQLPKGTFPSEKYQFDGWAQSLGIPLKTFLKMSVIPVDETFATINGETFPNIGLILKFMRDNKVGGIVLPSGQKYGKPTKPNRAGFKYAENGLIEFDAAPITSKMSYDLRFWGSQLKVAPNFKGTTSKATQAQTHTMSDMYMDGVLAVGGEVAAAKLKRYNDLINLQVKNRFNKMLSRLSITKVRRDGETFYNLSKESYEEVLKMLESEGVNREVGEGLLQGLKYYRKKNDTSFKFEYLVDAKRMEGSFYSIMAKSVIKHKLKGEMLTLVPSFGYEVVRGKGGIIEDRKLGFYENPDGKWTMDVYMPHQFEQFLEQDLHVVDGQIYDPITGIIMEGSAKLLEMLGIRIPTDGNHSVDLINIKGFLPYEAGPKIIVPPGLLIKSGTDFDIDKMTTYFQSHKVVGGKLVAAPVYDSLEEWFAGEQKDGLAELELAEKKYREENMLLRAQMADPEAVKLFLISTNAKKTSEDEVRILVEAMEKLEEDLHEFFIRDQTTGKLSPRSFESWQAENPTVTLADRTSEGAIQNEMMDIMRDLLGMKERAEDLLRPVNITDMQHFADEIYRKAAEAYDIPNLGDVSDYHEATSLHNILRVTQAYWQGKDAVGITAVASTHHVKSQIAGLKLNMETPVQRNTLGVIEPKLYFTGFENSPNEISLGRLYGNIDSRGSELKISNVLSQNVNAAVDTVNKPVLHILNMGPQMLPAAIFLIRAGVPLESVTYFLNQPIVREYMKQSVKGSGKLLRVAENSDGKSPATYEKQHIQAALGKFGQGSALTGQSSKKTYFDPETLKKMMGMSPASMSEEERNAQGQILRDLFVYMTIGEDLSTLAIVQAFDTKPPKGRIHSRVMMKKYNDLLERNVFINAEKITDSASSFLYEMKNYNEEAPKVVRELFVAEQLDEVYNEAFEFRLNELTHPNRRMGIDDVVKDLVRLEQGFISAILQRVAPVDGGAVADHAQRLLYGKNSMARQLLSIQEDESHPLNQNFWIRNMISMVQENPDEAGLNDHIELWNKTMTSLDLAVLNEAFKEIVAYDGLRGTTIAKDLLRTAILQSGTINSPFSFLETLDGEMVAKTFEEIIGTYLNDPSTLGIPSTEKRPAFLRFLMALDNNYKSRRPYAGIKSKNKKKYIPLTVQKTKEGVWVLEYNIEVNGKIVSENATMPFTDSPSYLNLSPRQALSTDRNAEYENNDQSDIICP